MMLSQFEKNIISKAVINSEHTHTYTGFSLVVGTLKLTHRHRPRTHTHFLSFLALLLRYANTHTISCKILKLFHIYHDTPVHNISISRRECNNAPAFSKTKALSVHREVPDSRCILTGISGCILVFKIKAI